MLKKRCPAILGRPVPSQLHIPIPGGSYEGCGPVASVKNKRIANRRAKPRNGKPGERREAHLRHLAPKRMQRSLPWATPTAITQEPEHAEAVEWLDTIPADDTGSPPKKLRDGCVPSIILQVQEGGIKTVKTDETCRRKSNT